MEFSKYAEVNPKCGRVPESFYYIDLECVNAGEIKDLRIEMANTAPSRAQRLLTLYDILFQTVRPYQRNNYHFKVENDLPTVASTGYAVFRTEQSSEYLYELIHTERFLSDIMKRCTGTSFPAVSSSDIEDIAVWIPEFQEQKKIGDFLTLIDTKIAKQRLLIEHLKKYKRGVMRKVFDDICCSYYKSSLENLCVSISSGKTTSVKDCGKYPLIGSTGPIGYTDFEEFNEELVLVARVGANAGAVNYYAGACGVTDNTLVVRVDKAHCNPKYILYFLEYYDPHRLIFGSGQPLVTGGQLKKIEVPIISNDQQEKVVELFSLLNRYCTCAQEQLDALICEKKALLQQLFI